MTRTRLLALVLAAVGALPLAGCALDSVSIKEGFGYAKREQLVDRVQDAKEGQQQAKEQFQSALEEFLAVTNAPVGQLESRYAALRREYSRCESIADDVRSRILGVERVADALFREWQNELEQFADEGLRQASAAQLAATRGRYLQLLGAMNAASSKMDPVLTRFKDQVLFLKHNLNARAVAALDENLGLIEADVATLVSDMEKAIDEARAFIEQMSEPTL